MLRIKRGHEDPSEDDGLRTLVDRLWPQGLSKGRAKMDIWMKDIGPNSALCRWFGHEASKPSRWNEFRTELLEGAR